MKRRACGLILFYLCLCITSFSQSSQGLLVLDLENSRLTAPEKIKVVKKYTNELGLVKLGPSLLMQEVFYDESGRVASNVDYKYDGSIFGSISSVIKTDFTYFPASNKVQTFKKTHASVIQGKRTERQEGRAFNEAGNLTHILFYQPSGAVDSIPINEFKMQSLRQTTYKPNQSYGAIRDQEPFTHYKGAEWDFLPQQIKVDKIPRYADPESYSQVAVKNPSSPAPNSLKRSSNKKKDGKEEQEIKTVREELIDGYAIKKINEREKKVLSEHRVKLNKQNKPVQVIDLNGPDQVSITSYLYDDAGNEVEVKQVNRKGDVVGKYNHSYDKNGLLVESVMSQGKDKVVKKVRYEYDFY